MIDLHCHILPGIDDGPAAIEESLDLARVAYAAGTRTMVATSHVSPAYPNGARAIGVGVDAVNAALAAQEIALEVRSGGEVATAQVLELAPDELRALHLGSGPWLLLESPFSPAVDFMAALVRHIQDDGHRIVLAHPERCPGFHRKPELLRTLIREQDVLASVTAGSLVGQFGREVERFARAMAAEGLIHNVASDAHDCDRRPPALAEPLERAGLGAHIDFLVCEVPRAILDGGDLPEHPGPMLDPPRRSWWRR